MMPLTVPELVRNRAIAAGASDWLEGLPSLVAALAREWSIRLGHVYSGGSEALVADATLPDGTAAVLKVLMPSSDGAITNEITTLRLADGVGCARLVAADATRRAMLLERLGRPLGECGRTVLEQVEILCTTAETLWRPARGSGLPTGAAKGRWLVEFIRSEWERLDRPCSEEAVTYAVECAERRIAAHDDERAVLVHGDIHPWNALEADGGFKLIDPDGLLAEAEYDLGVIMREGTLADPVYGDERGRARWLARRTGLDEAAIWEWAAVERVSTGLVLVAIGQDAAGRGVLKTAEEIARSD